MNERSIIGTLQSWLWQCSLGIKISRPFALHGQDERMKSSTSTRETVFELSTKSCSRIRCLFSPLAALNLRSELFRCRQDSLHWIYCRFYSPCQQWLPESRRVSLSRNIIIINNNSSTSIIIHSNHPPKHPLTQHNRLNRGNSQHNKQ